MAKYKGHYYASAQKKDEHKPTDWGKIGEEPKKLLELTPPLRLQDKALEIFEDWSKRFSDDWINNVASINANNSIAQYNEYILNRLSYVECSHLACDTIMNNALEKFTNSIMASGGEIKIPKTYDSEELDTQGLIQKIEDRAKDLQIYEKVRALIHMSLTYGKGDIFIDVDSSELDKPIIKSPKVFTSNKIRNLQVVPPYTMGAVDVETMNVLEKDYMCPRTWYVQGAGNVDRTRLLSLVMFDTPLLIRPMYNFGGIPLVQFMKNYIASADSARQSLSDILLRFKTNTIKTSLNKINPEEANERAKSINRQRNNLGTLLLNNDEEYVETITPIAGLEGVSAHLMQYASVSARLPATILFGLTPSGLNATGEQEAENFNKEVKNFQNNKVKPIIEQLLHFICLELDLDIKPEFQFNEISNRSKTEEAQTENTYIDIALKSIDGGIMTHDQAVDYLISKGIYPDTFVLAEAEEEEELDEDLNYE